MASLPRLVSGAVGLATLPSIYLRLSDVASDPRTGATEVGRVISEDPALSARLLRLVNGALYGLSYRIETIDQALMVAGTSQVLDLALANSVIRVFAGIPASMLDVDAFWRHSIATGLAARAIAVERGESNAERFFVAGLLHDLGRMVLALHEPQRLTRALEDARAGDVMLHHAERAVLGFDHADVGAGILAAWRLPPALQQAVAYHHAPLGAVAFPIEAATVHIADVIAHSFELGASGQPAVPTLESGAWDRLGLAPSALSGIVDNVRRQYVDVVQVMLIYESSAAGSRPAAQAS
jgi:putative nucleotidyltransferase with HDIG domain